MLFYRGLHSTSSLSLPQPWQIMDEVEYATMDWVDWFNHHSVLEPIGNMPPAELELMYHQQIKWLSELAWIKQPSLRTRRVDS
jgi:putative transposase